MAGSSTAVASRKPAARRGSAFTDKQIAYAVRDCRAVQVLLSDSSMVTGWVYGMDDFHWGLVTSVGELRLIHKSAPSLTITEITLEEQPSEVRDVVDPLAEPFRAYVMREHFKTSAS